MPSREDRWFNKIRVSDIFPINPPVVVEIFGVNIIETPPGLV